MTLTPHSPIPTHTHTPSQCTKSATQPPTYPHAYSLTNPSHPHTLTPSYAHTLTRSHTRKTIATEASHHDTMLAALCCEWREVEGVQGVEGWSWSSSTW